MRRSPSRPLLLAVALFLAACSAEPAASPTASDAASPRAGACPALPPVPAEVAGWPAPGMLTTTAIFPYLASSEIVCGRGRLLFTFLDKENVSVAAPDRPAGIALYDLTKDPATPVSQVEARFVWAIEGESGMYVATVELPASGTWGAEFRTIVDGKTEGVRMRFDVQPTGSAVRVGQAAPSVKTPTLVDVGGEIAKVSSDPKPRPAFYERSVDEALRAGEPFVLAFATPAFCTSRYCGPTLETVKRVADANPGIRVINVEPYELTWSDGRLQPKLDANGGFIPTGATNAYGILTEPWVFVIDRGGIVRGSFEGVLAADELQAAIDTVR